MGRTIITAAGVGALLLGIVAAAAYRPDVAVESPRDRMPPVPAHLDHADLITGSITTGPEATKACLECHPNAAREMMQTAHWTWAGQKVQLPGHDEPLSVGKKNLFNNFCVHVGPNMAKCSSCHVGYGWEDDTFDFSNEENVDCLVCHDRTGTYRKGLAGYPEKDVDLVEVARSVGRPTRSNCGQCHFKGGGGDAVKHGDLDGTMYFPSERLDVHMGGHDFQCVDCHRTAEHDVAGRGMPIGTNPQPRVRCTDCHDERPHGHERLDAHTRTVACQTCHIPRMAIDSPTKMAWDWSEAGQDGREEDPHVYMKKKGSFQYAKNIRPEYFWHNGQAARYMSGDKIDLSQPVLINRPLGNRDDPDAKIWPFKVHEGKQIYDAEHRHLLAPKMFGPNGYWKTFDWDLACREGSKVTGVPFSGRYDFVETAMFWPLSHMVQRKEKTLQCVDCHAADGIMDWRRLGYDGDPALHDGSSEIAQSDSMSGNCGQCHGRVEKGREPLALDLSLAQSMTAATGQIFSAQRMSDSAMNLADKAELARPWDIHAGAMLDCTSCHRWPNDPATVKQTGGKGLRHLAFDPRKAEPAAYVHRGQRHASQADATGACADCHDASAVHDWLPHRETHFAKLSCQACHIPEAYSPALRGLDWTVLRSDGSAEVAWRGVDGDPLDPAALITGFRPTLLPAKQADGKTRLVPHNVVANWHWVDASKKAEPIDYPTLRAAFFLSTGQYHPAIMAALDENHDGRLDASETRLDTKEKVAAVGNRLMAVGVDAPRIRSRIEPHALHHGVAPARRAIKACDECHSADSRLAEPVLLASHVPGDVLPVFAGAADTRIDERGRLRFMPRPADMDVYVAGLARPQWVDLLGGGLLAVVFAGILMHASRRLVSGRERAQTVGTEPSNEESNRS